MPLPPTETELLLLSEQGTAALAARIAPFVGPGFVLYLSGDLGAGKTTFARGLLRALGHAGRVRSPTFTLVESYALAQFALHHFDFYRFSDVDEWREAGFDEQIGGDAAALVEWPELAGPGLPAPDIWIRLRPEDARDAIDGPRLATLSAGSDRGQRCLNAILAAAVSGSIADVFSGARPSPPAG